MGYGRTQQYSFVCISSMSLMFALLLRPCTLTNALTHMDTEVQEEKNTFKAQAAKDWERLLVLRAKELVPGWLFFHCCIDTFCVTVIKGTVISV